MTSAPSGPPDPQGSFQLRICVRSRDRRSFPPPAAKGKSSDFAAVSCDRRRRRVFIGLNDRSGIT
jgi:hypothetical protein